MGFSLILYKFDKKFNSTKTPQSVPYQIFTGCTLKDNTSMTAPVFILTGADSLSPFKYNYAYVEAFDRYYFVNDWSYNRGSWEASLSVDVLASFRLQIGNSSQYVLRCADSIYWDDKIVDTQYPMKAGTSIVRSFGNFNYLNGSEDAMQYVVSVICKESNVEVTKSSVQSYTLFPDQFNGIMTALLSTPNYLDISEIEEGLQKALVNPLQYVTKAQWIPFDITETGADATFKLGWWTVSPNTYSRVLSNIIHPTTASTSTRLVGETYITIPKHPQALTRGYYLNTPPFSTYTLHTGVWGDIELDANDLVNSTELHLVISEIEIATGMARLLVYNGRGSSATLICDTVARLSVDIPMAAMLSDPLLGLAGKALGSINLTGGSGFWGAVGDGITNATSGISNVINAAASGVQAQGSPGSAINLIQPYITAKFLRIADENDEHLGRPVCKDLTLNTINGYILCADGELAIGTATSGELEELRSYLTGGFFYE